MKLFVRSSKAPSQEQWEDERLLQAWQEEGEQTCYDVLYNRYLHLVYGVCRKYINDTEACRDATMKVFSALSELPKEKAIRSLPNWLYTTARNICVSHKRRLDNQLVLKADEHFFEKNADGFMENEALTRLLHEEHPHLIDLLPGAMQQLEEHQRRCLELFFLKGESYRSISQQTGYTPKQVKSYLQNGKRKLGIILKRRHENQAD